MSKNVIIVLIYHRHKPLDDSPTVNMWLVLDHGRPQEFSFFLGGREMTAEHLFTNYVLVWETTSTDQVTEMM
jgi:hypothetical protein